MSHNEFQPSQYPNQPAGGYVPGFETNAPARKRKPRRWPWIVAVPVATVALIAVVNGSSDPETEQPESAVTTMPQLLPVTATPPTFRAPIATQIDPLNSDGTFRVGKDIEPGTYSVSITSRSGVGYWARCASIACEITFDGTETGMLGNELLTGPGYLEILPSDAYVQLRGVSLVAE